MVIGCRRMFRPEKKQQNHDRYVAYLAGEQHVGDSAPQQTDGHDVSTPADQHVQDMPAVELTDRNQIECRDENPHPAGEQHGV